MCEFCGVQMNEGESYTCPACGRRFCSAHHEPGDHNCTGIKANKRATHTSLPEKNKGGIFSRLFRK
ncbi:MAG: AN1-type zinc finger protein [Methanoregulaceae archaeon]